MNILIVEDNEALAQTTGWIVEMFGHDYRFSHDAGSAIATAADYKPHVIIMDIGLPGMSGYDLCRQMRADPALSQTIFIAQTGRSEPEHRQMAEDAGFHHHIVKPANIEKLQALLDDIAQSLSSAA
ncbi:response regulator [Asticcacaulis machinosus]|uniref:Response regulator n=1 Tax=Asticcacaulis machinosus TaxID=2984211 RepID=A0ABT5HNT1_9CAUL|nr:response regulator [Asticcacaulis machinosus]MDC7677678.1 response regulator [Asticcacaulis machinosus]